MWYADLLTLLEKRGFSKSSSGGSYEYAGPIVHPVP